MTESSFSRRSFIKKAGVVGSAAACVGAFGLLEESLEILPESAEAAEESTNENFPGAFYFNQSTCIGCLKCIAACTDYNELPNNISYRRVYDYEGGSFQEGDNKSMIQTSYIYHTSISCNHCGDPACTKACPTTAMHKEKDTELVLVDEDKCIACGYCLLACPYDAPYISKEFGHSIKCNACKERLENGEQTACVEACPTDSLDFGNMSKQLDREGVELLGYAPMPDPLYTAPACVITKHPDAKPVGDTSGKASLRGGR